MNKIDYKKVDKLFYSPPKTPTIIRVPTMQFLMVDGAGDPNTCEEYRHAVEALYAVSYTLKFAMKKSGNTPDYTVLPLEGLWWAENMDTFTTGSKDDWLWTSMIRQPEFITQENVDTAVEGAQKKKSLPAIDKLRLEPYEEGTCVQVMYVGPYANEGPTIANMHQYAFDQGYELSGKHHEIYLSDPRRVAPEKLKTVIRQPITRS